MRDRHRWTKTFELRAALGLARLYTQGRSKEVIEVLAPAIAAFDRGQDLPEIEAGESLLMATDGRMAAQ